MSRLSNPCNDRHRSGRFAAAPRSASKKQFGVAPNLFRLVANSPAALEGYLGLLDALGKGTLPLKTRARIALAVAEVNGCDYCLSAHTYLGKNLAKLDDSEMEANRGGASNDAKANVAVSFAAKVVRERGRVSDDDLRALRAAGYDDGSGDRDRAARRAQHLDELHQPDR